MRSDVRWNRDIEDRVSVVDAASSSESNTRGIPKASAAFARGRRIHIENSGHRKIEPPINRQMRVAHDAARADDDDRARRRRQRPSLRKSSGNSRGHFPAFRHRRLRSGDASMRRGRLDNGAHHQRSHDSRHPDADFAHAAPAPTRCTPTPTIPATYVVLRTDDRGQARGPRPDLHHRARQRGLRRRRARARAAGRGV